MITYTLLGWKNRMLSLLNTLRVILSMSSRMRGNEKRLKKLVSLSSVQTSSILRSAHLGS